MEAVAVLRQADHRHGQWLVLWRRLQLDDRLRPRHRGGGRDLRAVGNQLGHHPGRHRDQGRGLGHGPARYDVLHHDRRDFRRPQGGVDGARQRGGAAHRIARAGAKARHDSDREESHGAAHCQARGAPRARHVVGGRRGLSVRKTRPVALSRSRKGPREGHDPVPRRQIIPAGAGRLSPRQLSAPVTAERQSIALRPLLRPRSVAIVGVSPEPGSLGGNVLNNLNRIGYTGDVHLVSRSNREIDGRACVGSIDELPEGIDVAVLAVPRQASIDAVRACVRRKIGAALVFASGFAEMDEAGRAEQDAMARIANEAKLALCGPNCIGLVNLTDRVALTFEPLSLPAQARGRGIGVVTQSGAMCSTLRLALLAKGLKLSIVVSTGNEAQLTTEHFLEFLIDDDATEVIVLFMEQVRDPALFLALAARARERKKPIVLMHPGRSARAQESARTHTGAMVGNHAVMTALVAHEAVVRVETLEELLDTAEILARFAGPPIRGAAVMTNSGAFKGYALDFAETLGLELPELSAANAEAIKKILPPFAAIENPVDTTAQTVRDPSILGSTAAQLLADPAMGSLVIAIVAGAPRFAMDKANAILSGIANLEKPIAVATMGDETELPVEFSGSLREKGLAFFRSPDRALRAMARATWYGNAVTSTRPLAEASALPAFPLPNSPPLAGEGGVGAGALTEYQGKALLAMLGIAVPEG